MPQRERPKSWQRFLEHFGVGEDEASDRLEFAPLLGSEQPRRPPRRAPQRIITGDGAATVVYPNTPAAFTTPPTFSFDLPSPLEDTLPSPLYRSHVAALNALLRSAHDRRRSKYVGFCLLLAAFGAFVCALSLWLAIKENTYWAVGICVALTVSLWALQPILARAWFADLLDTVESEVNRILVEWNARAPKNVRFQILGAGNVAVHPRYGLGESAPSEPELHVVLLDSPASRRHSDYDETGPSDVLITPDGDGLMLSVKVVPRQEG
ncbi:hypothetical protein SpCBS45565_g00995 [Spizellomyces sp. 'palustris']|nr:hypothetical protein SpCBS45565_g00995 [Spizellomyces sp. 'palustris']